jgi:hypothetical protein
MDKNIKNFSIRKYFKRITMLESFSYSLQDVSTLNIILYFLNGFVWGLVSTVYNNLRWKQNTLSLGDLLYVLLISTPGGYFTLLFSLIWVIGHEIEKRWKNIFNFPVIK